MTTSERRAWDRERYLEDLSLNGFLAIDRSKYLALAGYQNWCSSANREWLNDWRREHGVKSEIKIVVTGSTVVLIDPTNINTPLGNLSSYSG